MRNLDWKRWAPVSGIAYVILFLIAFSIAGDVGDTDEEILSHFADSGNRAAEVAAYFLIVVGALFFLWFVGTLRARIRSVEAEPKSLSALAFGAGVASAALLVAALSVLVAISVTVEDSDQFVLDPNVARAFESAGYLIFVGSGMVASVLVTATSLAALKTDVLPTWLGWIGLVVAVALLVSIFFFPIFVLLAWVLVVSVTMIARPVTAQPREQVGTS